MKEETPLGAILQQIRLLRPPKHSLATFGTTSLRYVLLSPLDQEPASCRLREGEVTAQRPKIITPEIWAKRFEGFGEDEQAYGRQIEKTYGDSFRALEYNFRNHLTQTTVEHARLPEVAERTRKVLADDDAPRTALLEGPDNHWPLAVMKFIVEMSLRSFPSNLRELEEHDSFHPERRDENIRRREIEQLFQKAQSDPSAIKALGERLKFHGLFNEYEDRFFGLIR